MEEFTHVISIPGQLNLLLRHSFAYHEPRGILTGSNTERVINAVEDGIFLTTQIYD